MWGWGGILHRTIGRAVLGAVRTSDVERGGKFRPTIQFANNGRNSRIVVPLPHNAIVVPCQEERHNIFRSPEYAVHPELCLRCVVLAVTPYIEPLFSVRCWTDGRVGHYRNTLFAVKWPDRVDRQLGIAFLSERGQHDTQKHNSETDIVHCGVVADEIFR